MREIVLVTATALVLATVVACGPPEKSASGFRLPDGDVERGKEAFVELRCNACHTVKGLDLPAPVADPPVPVALGGLVNYQPTDGRFVTAIIHPDHELASGYPKELILSGMESRMADYSDVMTVRDLVDLVAFLHSRYDYTAPQAVH
jgi:mono/diheme cytochrome c family protein